MAQRNALGTVFALPLDDRRQGIGQVVGRLGGAQPPFYVAVFEGLHEDEDVDAALRAPVVLLALTMEMLLKRGAWRILGHREIAHGGVPLPAYREESPDGAVVVDYAGQRALRGKPDLAERLGYRTSVSPGLVDDAFRALHGEGVWEADFDELRPPAPYLTSDAIYGSPTPEQDGGDTAPSDEQEVATHLPLSGEDYGTKAERDAVQQLGHRIDAALKPLGGEHDGHEFGNGEAVLFSYGPDADQVFEVVQRCLADFDVRPGAYAVKRYGPAGDSKARKERVELR